MKMVTFFAALANDALSDNWKGCLTAQEYGYFHDIDLNFQPGTITAKIDPMPFIRNIPL